MGARVCAGESRAGAREPPAPARPPLALRAVPAPRSRASLRAPLPPASLPRLNLRVFLSRTLCRLLLPSASRPRHASTPRA